MKKKYRTRKIQYTQTGQSERKHNFEWHSSEVNGRQHKLFFFSSFLDTCSHGKLVKAKKGNFYHQTVALNGPQRQCKVTSHRQVAINRLDNLILPHTIYKFLNLHSYSSTRLIAHSIFFRFFLYLQCEPGLGASVMYNLLYNKPQKLMLLAGCSTVCTTVAEAAKMWNLIVVSNWRETNFGLHYRLIWSEAGRYWCLISISFSERFVRF